MKRTLDVAVRDLQPGDYLPASKQTVRAVYASAYPEMRGKREVILQRDNAPAGTHRSATWNANTRIRIERGQ